jgi:hypothetical protein
MVETKDYRLLNKGARLLQAIAVVAMVSLPLMAVAAETQQIQPTAPGTTVVAPGEEPLAVEVTEYSAGGDANIGRTLFTGETRFTNGGPPCISCHSAGVGALGGGILAPNLTKAFADPSKNPLMSTAWVNGGGSPVMGPIFSNKNITQIEMLNLRAFFKVASEKDVAPSSTGKFTILGLLGSVGILVLFTIVWSKRYSKRNQNTAHDALWRNYGGKGGR